jgi:hypothetical protein
MSYVGIECIELAKTFRKLNIFPTIDIEKLIKDLELLTQNIPIYRLSRKERQEVIDLFFVTW